MDDDEDRSRINIAAFGRPTRIFTDEAARHWVGYDFDPNMVEPTHYTVQSSTIGSPVQWVVEGSEDGFVWKAMDQRLEQSKLREPGSIATFHVTEKFPCRKVRFLLVGENCDGRTVLVLQGFEIFGSINPPGCNLGRGSPKRKSLFGGGW
jgi:hypothetical protein